MKPEEEEARGCFIPSRSKVVHCRSSPHVYMRSEEQRLEKGERERERMKPEEGMHSPDETRTTWPPAPDPKPETLAMGDGSQVGFDGSERSI